MSKNLVRNLQDLFANLAKNFLQNPAPSCKFLQDVDSDKNTLIKNHALLFALVPP